MKLRSPITGAELTVLDAAHIANADQPAAYAHIVLTFLAHNPA
jgi:hypothetical protein